MRCIATVVSSALVITAVLPVAWAQEPGQPIAAPASRTAVSPTNPTTSARRLLPGTRPNVFTTIQGNALSASNGGLANVSVRLRDARFGHIVDSQVTDKSGLFAFRTVDPGSYIVELMGTENAVIASSPMLNVTAGETVSAVVKLPFRILPLGGFLGQTVPSAVAVSSAAAASGVLATTVTGVEATNTKVVQ